MIFVATTKDKEPSTYSQGKNPSLPFNACTIEKNDSGINIQKVCADAPLMENKKVSGINIGI